VLAERVKAGPPQLASGSEDPSPPQPEPEPELEPDPAAIAAEAEKLKEEGNQSFKRARYGEAVDLYTKAIGMSSSLSSSFPSFLSLPFHEFHPQSLLSLADPLTRY
jgi:hypothetical protein